MRRGENGLCADPPAKSRFYRLAAAAVLFFARQNPRQSFRGKNTLFAAYVAVNFSLIFTAA